MPGDILHRGCSWSMIGGSVSEPWKVMFRRGCPAGEGVESDASYQAADDHQRTNRQQSQGQHGKKEGWHLATGPPGFEDRQQQCEAEAEDGECRCGDPTSPEQSVGSCFLCGDIQKRRTPNKACHSSRQHRQCDKKQQGPPGDRSMKCE